MPAAELLNRLLSTLQRELTTRAAVESRLAEPAQPAEAAAKGLRTMLERGRCPEASTAQAQMASIAIIELFAHEQNALCLCAWANEATATIHAIDNAEVDTAEVGLARWGHLRQNCLAVLLQMASSPSTSAPGAPSDTAQGRCVELLEKTERHAPPLEGQAEYVPGAASVCLDVLASHASDHDLAGVQIATNLLRNLALPPSNRPVVGALRDGSAADAVSILLRHVPHADPSVSVHAAATARILCEGCVANTLRFLGSTRDGHALAPVFAIDRSRVHPHGQAELARFACCVMSACGAPPLADDARCGPHRLHGTLEVRVAATAMPAFLLASSARQLHLEACAALRAARFAEAALEGSAAWSGDHIAVRRGARELPIKDALEEIIRSGGLTAKECEGLLEVSLS